MQTGTSSPWLGEGDLRRVLSSRLLVKLALDAVQTLDWSNPDLIGRSSRRYRPQMMLTLLGYCYASGIYGSAQIEEAIRHDQTVRYLCARDYPDRAALRQFRRENRAAVERCLADILKQAWSWRQEIVGLRGWGRPPGDSEPSRRSQKEAYQRLEVASFTDLMEAED